MPILLPVFHLALARRPGRPSGASGTRNETSTAWRRTAACYPASSAMEMRSGASETRSSLSSYFLTASFNALAAVNLGAFVAGILIGLPVLGLTP